VTDAGHLPEDTTDEVLIDSDGVRWALRCRCPLHPHQGHPARPLPAVPTKTEAGRPDDTGHGAAVVAESYGDDKVLSTRGRSVLEGADVLAEGVQAVLDAFPGAAVVEDELIRPGDPAGGGGR